jgi:hypothetical protein
MADFPTAVLLQLCEITPVRAQIYDAWQNACEHPYRAIHIFDFTVASAHGYSKAYGVNLHEPPEHYCPEPLKDRIRSEPAAAAELAKSITDFPGKGK